MTRWGLCLSHSILCFVRSINGKQQFLPLIDLAVTTKEYMCGAPDVETQSCVFDGSVDRDRAALSVQNLLSQ